jgi:hypothetical protein
VLIDAVRAGGDAQSRAAEQMLVQHIDKHENTAAVVKLVATPRHTTATRKRRLAALAASALHAYFTSLPAKESPEAVNTITALALAGAAAATSIETVTARAAEWLAATGDKPSLVFPPYVASAVSVAAQADQRLACERRCAVWFQLPGRQFRPVLLSAQSQPAAGGRQEQGSRRQPEV